MAFSTNNYRQYKLLSILRSIRNKLKIKNVYNCNNKILPINTLFTNEIINYWQIICKIIIIIIIVL